MSVSTPQIGASRCVGAVGQGQRSVGHGGKSRTARGGYAAAMTEVKLLLFDVFGTLVDWHGSIAREVHGVLGARGIAVDGAAFADAWRDQYQPAMEEVRSGRLPFSKLDVLHRRNLDVVLKAFGLTDVDEATRAASQPRLAPPRCLARRDAGAGAAAHALPPRALLERQHLADGRPGAPQRLALGRDHSAPSWRATTSPRRSSTSAPPRPSTARRTRR